MVLDLNRYSVMKKLVILLSLVVVSFVSMAQKYTYTPDEDTLTNAETVYVTLDQVVSQDFTAAFAVTVDSLSGTATIAATLQELVEDGKWVDNSSAVTLINAGDVNTKSYVWKLSNTQCLQYRVKLAQTGTASTSVNAKFVIKKRQ